MTSIMFLYDIFFDKLYASRTAGKKTHKNIRLEKTNVTSPIFVNFSPLGRPLAAQTSVNLFHFLGYLNSLRTDALAFSALFALVRQGFKRLVIPVHIMSA